MMTPRERDLLTALATYDSEFKSVTMLQYHHPRLKQYTARQLSGSATRLVRADLAIRTVINPERDVKYKITGKGRKFLAEAG